MLGEGGAENNDNVPSSDDGVILERCAVCRKICVREICRPATVLPARLSSTKSSSSSAGEALLTNAVTRPNSSARPGQISPAVVPTQQALFSDGGATCDDVLQREAVRQSLHVEPREVQSMGEGGLVDGHSGICTISD